MSPRLITILNASAVRMPSLRRREATCLQSRVAASQSDLVAEAGFGLFSAARSKEVKIEQLLGEDIVIGQVMAKAVERIGSFRREPVASNEPSEELLRDSIAMGKRLEAYFDHVHRNDTIVVQPRFSGCGILDSCYGDVIAGKCLTEIKAVDRTIRGADIKQILVYCGLNFAASNYVINEVALVNPRRGLVYRFKLHALIGQISRRTPVELFSEMVEFVSNYDLTRPGG